MRDSVIFLVCFGVLFCWLCLLSGLISFKFVVILNALVLRLRLCSLHEVVRFVELEAHQEGAKDHEHGHEDHLVVGDPHPAPVEEKSSALLEHLLPLQKVVELGLVPVGLLLSHHERVLSIGFGPLVDRKTQKVVLVLAVA